MISVIITTYNRPNLIVASLRSVLAQTYTDIEIIVVDGSDNNETRRKVFSSNEKRIKYLKVENISAANSRNIGIDEAKGDFIAFNDDDDVWCDGKVERQFGLFKKKHNKNFIVYSTFSKVAGGAFRRTPDDTVKVKYGAIFNELLLRNFVGLPTVMLPASICRKVKFDQQLKCLEDWDWMIRLSKSSSFEFIPESLVSVSDTPGSVNKSKYSVKAESYMTIYQKYYNDIILAPQIESKHLLSIGSNLCLSGEIQEGRAYLLKSLKMDPKRTNALIGYLLSFLGRRVFYSSYKIFEKLTHRQP